MNDSPYCQLATRLNELPNGFPPAPDGAELRLLTYLFTPEEVDTDPTSLHDLHI